MAVGTYFRMALSQTNVPAPATYGSDHATWQTVDICVQRKLFQLRRSQENMATRYTFPFIPSFTFNSSSTDRHTVAHGPIADIQQRRTLP
jgi:hypothetical protein